MMNTEEFLTLVEQTELEEYRLWMNMLRENNTPSIDEIVSEIFPWNTVIDVARRWNVQWQTIKVAIDSGQIKLSKRGEYSVKNGINYMKNVHFGISTDEIKRIEEKFPELKKTVSLVLMTKKKKIDNDIFLDLKNAEDILVRVSRLICNNFISIIEDDKSINVGMCLQRYFGERTKEKEIAKIFLKKYVLKDMEFITGNAKLLIDSVKEKYKNKHETCPQSNIEICLPKIRTANLNQGNSIKTTNATISNQKKRLQELTEGYEGAAKLAHAMTTEGPKPGNNPWTEEEILDLAKKMSVSITGDCLKAFKAGMPANLVKKNAGARPTPSPEESPDDVES